MNRLSRTRLESLDEWQEVCRFAQEMEGYYIRQALDAKTFAEKERAAGRVEILQAIRTWPRTLEAFHGSRESELVESLHDAH